MFMFGDTRPMATPQKFLTNACLYFYAMCEDSILSGAMGLLRMNCYTVTHFSISLSLPRSNIVLSCHTRLLPSRFGCSHVLMRHDPGQKPWLQLEALVPCTKQYAGMIRVQRSGTALVSCQLAVVRRSSCWKLIALFPV